MKTSHAIPPYTAIGLRGQLGLRYTLATHARAHTHTPQMDCDGSFEGYRLSATLLLINGLNEDKGGFASLFKISISYDNQV